MTLRDLIGLIVVSRRTGSGWQRREEVEACGEPALSTSSRAVGGDCGCLSTPAGGPRTAPTSPKSWPSWLSPDGISPTCCQQTTPNRPSSSRRALRSEGCAATSGLSAGRRPRRPGDRECGSTRNVVALSRRRHVTEPVGRSGGRRFSDRGCRTRSPNATSWPSSTAWRRRGWLR